ncbi:S8 family serine peptidase [Nonomuraea antimicrobica]
MIASGNGGGPGSVSSPGSADAALTVGAVDRSDQMANFSNRGPRGGDHAIKPDVTAPGVSIVAAAAQGTADGPYVAYSGTSMAAPHVAGAAAILAQQHPDWTGRQLKAALIGSAAPQAGATHFDQGGGRVDLVRATGQQVHAGPANLGAVFRWDESGERKATKEITYANDGDTPVTLDLTVDTDVLRTSAQRVEVPAKGTASVTVTIDATGTAPGDHPGTVTARSGDQIVRTVATAYVEPESYDVKISAIGADGQPAGASGEFFNDKGEILPIYVSGEPVTYRLPVGEWTLAADVWESDRITTAHLPVKVSESGAEAVLDTRQAQPIRFTLDEPTAVTSGYLEMWLFDGWWFRGWYGNWADPSAVNFVIPSKKPGLKYITRTHFQTKDPSPSRSRYDLVDERHDGIPEDPTYAAKVKDLDKVTTTFRGAGTAATGDYYVTVAPDDDPMGGFLTPTKGVPLPGTLTEYRTRGHKWGGALGVGASMVRETVKPIRDRARQTWGVAVSGPSFATQGAWREQDKLTFDGGRLLADGVPGRVGMDGAATGTISLTAGDQVISTIDYTGCGPRNMSPCQLVADLPAQAGTYTLSATATRQVPHSTLSTKVESAWTFRSETTSTREALP